jgi:hypothetical protein
VPENCTTKVALLRKARPMLDIQYASPHQRSNALPNACAMISSSLGRREDSFLAFREARRSTTMMAFDRSTLSYRAILFLFAAFGIASASHSATLEDSAREIAQKVVAALPARESVSCEIRNVSSLQPGEVARVERAFKAELQNRGVHLFETGSAAITVLITLSENFKSVVWTGEIRGGDASHAVFITIERNLENRPLSSAMPVTIHIEKFWEGPERILDGGEISDGTGKFWLLLLVPQGLIIQDKQTGSKSMTEIVSDQSASRDPVGILNIGPVGDTVGFILPPQFCTVKLQMRNLIECLPPGGPDVPAGGRAQAIIDIAPPGPPPAGKGTGVQIGSVCGGANRFLAPGSGDYTQTDSLQVFETQSGGAVAISAELHFPGPIMGLHAVSDTPRVVVQNLTTRNYEAYRLSFTCGQ